MWHKPKQQRLQVVGPDERLANIFSQVGKRYGYSKVEAKFVDFDKGPIVKYDRRGRTFKVRVSRFYEGFPDENLATIADAVYHDIATGGWRHKTSDEWTVLEV